MANPKLPDPEHVQYAHNEMAKGRSSREVAAELATLGVPVSHMTVARWAKQWPAQQARAAAPGPMVAPASARASAAPERCTRAVPKAGASRGHIYEQGRCRQCNVTEPVVVGGGQPSARLNPLAAEIAARKAEQPPPPEIDATDTLGTLRGLLESFVGEAHRSREGNPRLAATLAKSAADVLDQIRKIEARQAEDESCLKISREEIAKAKAAAFERLKALCDRPLQCSDCGRKLAIAWGEAAEKVAEALKGEGV